MFDVKIVFDLKNEYVEWEISYKEKKKKEKVNIRDFGPDAKFRDILEYVINDCLYFIEKEFKNKVMDKIYNSMTLSILGGKRKVEVSFKFPNND